MNTQTLSNFITALASSEVAFSYTIVPVSPETSNAIFNPINPSEYDLLKTAILAIASTFNVVISHDDETKTLSFDLEITQPTVSPEVENEDPTRVEAPDVTPEIVEEILDPNNLNN